MKNFSKNMDPLIMGGPYVLLHCPWTLCPLLPLQIPSPPLEVSPFLLLLGVHIAWILSCPLTSLLFHLLSNWDLIYHDCQSGRIHYQVFIFGHGQPLGGAAVFIVLPSLHSFSHLLLPLQPTRMGCIWVFSQGHLSRRCWWDC